jgi:hypothetical protein
MPPDLADVGTELVLVSGALELAITGSSSPRWTQGAITLNYTGNYAPKNSVVILAVGTNNRNFSGVPLPFEIPGTNGTPSGPCFVYNTHALVLPAFTTATGAFTANLALPGDPMFHGATTFAQVLGVDAAANPLGLVTSNMVAHNLVTPYPAMLVGNAYLAGLFGTGTIANSAGQVVCFEE